MNHSSEKVTVPPEHKRRSHEETRAVLLEAIARLLNMQARAGTPAMPP